MIWLIDEQVGLAIASARRAGFSFSAEQVRLFEERTAVAAEGDPRNLTRAGDSVEILIDGPLTEKADIWAYYYGGGNTTYASIVRALGVAQSDPSVKSVILRVNSPGGTVDGLFDALAALETFRADSGKSISVVASKAQSAAYALAALGGKITAVTAASFFGSKAFLCCLWR